MCRRPPRGGFTLVEVATVVAVIAVLIMLLLPAIQSSREFARRSQCVNNLTQIGLALASYEATHRALPTGVFDRGETVDDALHGYRFGWIPQILPHLERRNIANHLNFQESVHAPAQGTARLMAITTLLCPSDAGSVRGPAINLPPFARSQYAACHHHLDEPIRADNQGAFPLNGHLSSDDFPDGLATTIFVGEKRSGGDEIGWTVGTRATLRNTGLPPNQTQLPDFERMIPPPPGASPNPNLTPVEPYPIVGGFGASHPHGVNFLFGDGSVRFVGTGVRLEVYRRLGHRDDGTLVDDESF